jgi:UDP-N-acetylmuramate--alanine ligase
MIIYFAGIGGVGIGPLAEIALDAGHKVLGSDPHESPITDHLASRGAIISVKQDGAFLESCHNDQKIDLYVHSSAISSLNPEYQKAQYLMIPTTKRDGLLAQIIAENNLELLAVSGTHGKTTTTGMVIWAFKQLGIPISYSIGTTLGFGPNGVLTKDSKYFVYECDEFDRNFLHFNPLLSLIPSLDYDHPDTYSTQEKYDSAFRQFSLQSKTVITWSDQRPEVYNGLGNVIALNAESDINPEIKLPGQHNRLNATLVQKGLASLGISVDSTILNSFPGTNRRFEKLTDGLYSDYGHHPIEIKATLEMASELSDRVALVYQPHQNARQHALKDLYTDQFEKAKKIFWLPTYLSRERSDITIYTPEMLFENVTNKKNIVVAEMNDTLWANIQDLRADGYLVLVMGAGDIDPWVRSRLGSSVNQ